MKKNGKPRCKFVGCSKLCQFSYRSDNAIIHYNRLNFLHPYYGVKKAGAPDVFGAPALRRV